MGLGLGLGLGFGFGLGLGSDQRVHGAGEIGQQLHEGRDLRRSEP